MAAPELEGATRIDRRAVFGVLKWGAKANQDIPAYHRGVIKGIVTGLSAAVVLANLYLAVSDSSINDDFVVEHARRSTQVLNTCAFKLSSNHCSIICCDPICCLLGCADVCSAVCCLLCVLSSKHSKVFSSALPARFRLASLSLCRPPAANPRVWGSGSGLGNRSTWPR